MPIIFCFLTLFLFIYLEFSLFVWIAAHIGVLGLILLLMCAFLFGVFMLRARGWYALLQVQKQLAYGEIPTRSLFKSGLWIMAGILFMLPGFLSDLIALLLLLPPIGLWLEKLIKNRMTFFSAKIFQKNDRTFYGYRREERHDTVFEAEYEKQADEDKRIK